MAVSLLLALASLVAWVMLVFVRPIGLGVTHVLLGLSGVLFIRWWALREMKPSTVNGQPSTGKA